MRTGVFQCVQVQLMEHTLQLRLHKKIMQPTCDDKYLFKDIVIGWPGSVQSAVSNRSKRGNYWQRNLSYDIGRPSIPFVELADKRLP